MVYNKYRYISLLPFFLTCEKCAFYYQYFIKIITLFKSQDSKLKRHKVLLENSCSKLHMNATCQQFTLATDLSFICTWMYQLITNPQ